MNLVTLQFETTNNFDYNLEKLISLINKTAKNDIIVAPELCLNGYAYDRMNEAVNITNKALPILTKLSSNKTIISTFTTKNTEGYQNTLFIFSNEKIIHTQSKYKLFPLGDEEKHFLSGNKEDIKIIEINGIKIANLICFELRFIELWEQIKGADIITIPAMWGKLRKEHYEKLSNALAIANQTYVIASDSSNEDMASSSGIITPFGVDYRDDTKEIISLEFNPKEIKKMRKYITIGLS
jgi:predicted amidohydrolase